MIEELMKTAGTEIVWSQLKPHKGKYIVKHSKELFSRVNQMIEL